MDLDVYWHIVGQLCPQVPWPPARARQYEWRRRGLSDAQIDSPARRFLNHWTTTDKNPRRDRVWDNWIDGEIDKFGLKRTG